MLSACATLAACGGDSSAAKEEQPILTEKSVVQVWKDYDKSNKAAMVKAGPPSYDGMAYDVVALGPTLDYDVAVAKVNEVDGARRGHTVPTVPKTLHARSRAQVSH